ncbi:hypothetical protein LV779_02955 [Streptomyces thinghirensis]|nr:hypothetical protein [Streptomyces thinghirensis]
MRQGAGSDEIHVGFPTLEERTRPRPPVVRGHTVLPSTSCLAGRRLQQFPGGRDRLRGGSRRLPVAPPSVH